MKLRPRTLAALAVATVALLVVLFSCRGGDEPTVVTSTGDQGHVPIYTASPAPSASPTESPSAPAGTLPQIGPQDVARSFVAAWASRGAKEPAGPWLARMRPYASPVLLTRLASTAPGEIAARRVTGNPDVIDSGLWGAQVVVPVDAGPAVLCGLASTGTQWLVTEVSPVNPDAT